MTPLVPIMMFGWLPLTLVLFAVLRPRRAATIALFGGWLFLPVATFEFHGLPEYTKSVATCLPVVLATVVFAPDRLVSLRPRAFDIPLLIWCICPLGSSLANNLGVYDGLSETTANVLTWGMPYIIGRMYYGSLRGLRELALGFVVGGLIYVPLCLWEIRMAPTLHHDLYGFITFKFFTTYRFGGYRPAVFMQHGIAVGLWMTTASLVALWLWRTGAVRRICGIPLSVLVVIQLSVTILCKSLNGIFILLLGVATLSAIRRWRAPAPLIALLAIPPVYVALRGTGVLSGEHLTAAATMISAERAASLEIRLFHEERLAEKAWQKPLLGWGGWGRNRVYDEDSGADTSLTDGFWIIAFGNYGLVGLLSVGTVLLLPTMAIRRGLDLHRWATPVFAPVAALAIVVPMYVIDCLMNGMLNPIYMVTVGGLLRLTTRLRPELSSASPLPCTVRPAYVHPPVVTVPQRANRAKN